jgi:hypothetical protein
MAASGSVAVQGLAVQGLADGVKLAADGSVNLVGALQLYATPHVVESIYIGSGTYVVPDKVNTYCTTLGSKAAAHITDTPKTANTMIGRGAGYGSDTSYNTFLGFGAGQSSSLTGNGGNTFVGYAAGMGLASTYDTLILSTFGFAHVTGDTNKFAVARPIQPPAYASDALPSASNAGVGAMIYLPTARKTGEASGAGTGCPAYSNGTVWLTFYGNTAAVF